MQIGEVTDDGHAARQDRGVMVAEIPNRALTDEAPRLSPADAGARPGCARCSSSFARRRRPRPGGRQDAFDRAARHRRPSPASAGCIGSTTTWCGPTPSTCPGMGAGVVRVKGTDRALAMSVDGNGRYCYLDPHRGAMLAVAEAARNVACAGARADRRHQLPEFRQSRASGDHVAVGEAVEGIGAACRALDIPITGGNVSLYNETDGRAIYPTPVHRGGRVDREMPIAWCSAGVSGRRRRGRAAGRDPRRAGRQ